MHIASRRFACFAVCLALVLAMSFLPETVYATSYTVTSPANDGRGSLRAAITSANASFSDDVITIEVVTVTLTTALPPLADNGTLTIVGEDYEILRAPGSPAFRIFEVSSGAEVTLSGLFLTGGSPAADQNGGAILNDGGTLHIIACNLYDNHADGIGSGGAIFNSMGVLTLTETSVYGNSAGSYGGGVANDGGTMTLENADISNNFITNFGSGGGLSNAGGGILTMFRVVMSTNTATVSGGAMINGAEATLTEVEIYSNSAPFGGAIYGGGSLTLNTVTISQNGADGFDGGGIYNDGGTVSATSSFFIQNGSDMSGGGIYNTSGGMVTLDDTRFSENEASGSGGAIHNEDGTVEYIGRQGAPVDENEAESGGAFSNAPEGTMMVTNASITDSFATGTVDGGGGIYNAGTFDLIDSSLSRSEAISGGGILNSGTLRVTDSRIFDNDATTTFGGGIYNSGGTLEVSRSSIRGNTAALNGGGIANDATATLTSSTISNNTAEISGGGFANEGTATVINVTVTGNSANSAFGGGGIYNANSGTVHLRNSIVANSTAGGECATLFATTNAQFSLIEGGLSCVSGMSSNNKTADPGLGSLTGGYFPLNPFSPAIDAGSNALIPAGATLDQPGSPRIIGSAVDMGAYESGAAYATMTLSLQGRPVAPDPAYVMTVHIQVRAPGSLTPLIAQDTVSDESGEVTLPNLAPGSYDLWIKGSHTLAQVIPVTVVAGNNDLTLVAVLREGDANDNNQVTLPDFSLLASAFGTAEGSPTFNAQADFNGSGTITITDFSLLASSFGTAGAP